MVSLNVCLEGKMVLVTGAAGFIGSNLVKRLFQDVKNIRVIGIDSMTDYYDVNIKRERLSEIEALVNGEQLVLGEQSHFSAAPETWDNVASDKCDCSLKDGSAAREENVASAEVICSHDSSSASREDNVASDKVVCSLNSSSAARWVFVEDSIANKEVIERIFAEYRPAVVVNLAAQAGVRYSINNPDAYIESNLIGFYNILEACRHHEVEHLVYASSSSVYGSNKKVPYSTDDKVDNPVSLYAATKKSNELMAHAYSKLYNIPSTGLRFFTVYGPAGRPDMAYFGFTNKLREGKTIQIFNYGNCKRDFTFVDDIVEGVVRIMQHAPEKATGEDGLPVPPYKVYNIGNNSPENLLDFVTILQEELIAAHVLPADYDFEAHKELVPMQPGDVPVTYADTTPLEQDFGFKPATPLRDGLRAFAQWYARYYGTAE